MKTVCGIDLGTQSCKVVLYDYEAKKIAASSSAAIELIAENDGTREQKAEWYEDALKICFGALPEDAKKTIAAIGVSGQQHGFVPLDENGKPLYNVKLWYDTATATECDEITKAACCERRCDGVWHTRRYSRTVRRRKIQQTGRYIGQAGVPGKCV